MGLLFGKQKEFKNIGKGIFCFVLTPVVLLLKAFRLPDFHFSSYQSLICLLVFVHLVIVRGFLKSMILP